MKLYKVLKPFIFRDVNRKIGEEIVCDNRKGEELLKKKLVANADKELDEKNPSHAPLVEEAKKEEKVKETKEEKEEKKRAAEKEKREAELDKELKEKREKAISLIPDDGETNIETMQKEIEAMDVDQLDETIKNLSEKKKKNK